MFTSSKEKNPYKKYIAVKKENIVIRAIKNPSAINVTILQKDMNILPHTWSRQPAQLHVTNLNSTIGDQMNEIIKKTKEMSTTSLFHKIATLTLAVFAVVGVITSFMMAFKLYKRMIHMKSEINQLRPTL